MAQAQELYPRCGIDSRSTYEFSEIFNGKVLFVLKQSTITFNILTVIS